MEQLFNKFETSLEMLIISNTCDAEVMNLGMESVNYFVENFPNLRILGNVRTWRSVDHFDENSANYFRAESEFARLKGKARKRNWDIDFEIENLDFLVK